MHVVQTRSKNISTHGYGIDSVENAATNFVQGVDTQENISKAVKDQVKDISKKEDGTSERIKKRRGINLRLLTNMFY